MKHVWPTSIAILNGAETFQASYLGLDLIGICLTNEAINKTRYLSVKSYGITKSSEILAYKV